MATIKINNKEYDYEHLPEKAKEQLEMLRFLDSELQRLRLQIDALQTARSTYGHVLLAALAENKTVN